jgi:transposase
MNELHLAGKNLSQAQKKLDEAKARAKAAANAAYAEGTYETTITAILDVDRMTVRRWLGKKK